MWPGDPATTLLPSPNKFRVRSKVPSNPSLCEMVQNICVSFLFVVVFFVHFIASVVKECLYK